MTDKHGWPDDGIAGIDLHDEIVKEIGKHLPFPAKCRARLVCRRWAVLVGECVSSVALSASQLKEVVWADLPPSATAKEQDLLQRALGRATASGSSAHGFLRTLELPGAASTAQQHTTGTAQQPAAAAAHDALSPTTPSSSSSSSSSSSRRQQAASSSRSSSRRAKDLRAARLEDNLQRIAAYARRISAAFPAAWTILLQVNIGYGPEAPPLLGQAVPRLAALLGGLPGVGRVRLSVSALGPDGNELLSNSMAQEYIQDTTYAFDYVLAMLRALMLRPAPRAALVLPPTPAAKRAARLLLALPPGTTVAAAASGDVGGADRCVGGTPSHHTANALYEDEQILEEGGGEQVALAAAAAGGSTSSSSSSSSSTAAGAAAASSGTPEAEPQDVSRPKQQHSSSSSSPADRTSPIAAAAAAGDQQAGIIPTWVLELHLAAFPSAPEAWEEFQDLPQMTALLLPTRAARLMPRHLPHLATLTQLRALQLGVTVPTCSETPAACDALLSLTALTRLTHLGLHGSGCSSRALTRSLCGLTGLMDLQLEGSVYVEVPRLAARLVSLKTLRLQQELTFDELTALTANCRQLTRLHCAGMWQTMSAGEAVAPLRLLQPNDHIPPHPAGAPAEPEDAAGGGGAPAPSHAAMAAAAGGFGAWPMVQGGAEGMGWQRPHPLLPLPPSAGGGGASTRGLRDAVTLALHTCMVQRAHLAGGPLMVLQLLNSRFESCSVEALSLVQLMEAVVSKSSEYAGDEVLVVDSEYVSDEVRAVLDELFTTGGFDAMDLPLDTLEEQQREAAAAAAAAALSAAQQDPTAPHASSAASFQQPGAASPAFDAGGHLLGDASGDVGYPGSPDMTRAPTTAAELEQRLMSARERVDNAIVSALHFTHLLETGEAAGGASAAVGFGVVTDLVVGTTPHASATELLHHQQMTPAPPTAAAPTSSSSSSSGVMAVPYSVTLTLMPEGDTTTNSSSLPASGPTRPTTTNGSSSTTNGTAAATIGAANQQQREKEQGVKELSMMVSNGADVSLLAAALPRLQRLTLLLPPSLQGVFDARPPERDLNLPPLRLSLGQAPESSSSSRSGGDGVGGSGSSSSAPSSPSAAAAADGDDPIRAARAATQGLRRMRQLVRSLDDLLGGFPVTSPGGAVSDTISDTLDPQPATTTTTSSSSSSSGAADAQVPLVLPHHRFFSFQHLKSLYIGSLTGLEAPWEPSLTIGDAAAAAVAAGCPVLSALQLSGVLSLSPQGFLALSGLKQLRSLGLEHWTNTVAPLKEQQMVLPLAALPQGLTSLRANNITLSLAPAATPLPSPSAAPAADSAAAATADDADAQAGAQQQHQQQVAALGCTAAGTCCIHSSASSSQSHSWWGRWGHATHPTCGCPTTPPASHCSSDTNNSSSSSSGEAAAGSSSGTTASSASPAACCLAGVMGGLEELVLMFGAGVSHGELALALPHATRLQRLHVAGPGTWMETPWSTAAAYGALSAARWVTAGLLPVSQLAAGVVAAVHGQHSGVWTRGLAGLGALQDVHIDLPLLLPGEVDALVDAVAANQAVRSLSAHGVVLSFLMGHTDMLAALTRLAPAAATAATATAAATAAQGAPAAAAGAGPVPSSTSGAVHQQYNSSSTPGDAAAAAGGLEPHLYHIDVGFARHVLVPQRPAAEAASSSHAPAVEAAAPAHGGAPLGPHSHGKSKASAFVTPADRQLLRRLKGLFGGCPDAHFSMFDAACSSKEVAGEEGVGSGPGGGGAGDQGSDCGSEAGDAAAGGPSAAEEQQEVGEEAEQQQQAGGVAAAAGHQGAAAVGEAAEEEDEHGQAVSEEEEEDVLGVGNVVGPVVLMLGGGVGGGGADQQGGEPQGLNLLEAAAAEGAVGGPPGAGGGPPGGMPPGGHAGAGGLPLGPEVVAHLGHAAGRWFVAGAAGSLVTGALLLRLAARAAAGALRW